MPNRMIESDLAAGNCLEGMIEPLASYICAVDHPRVALRSAWTLLLAEVEQTNRVALAQVGVFDGASLVYGSE